VEEVKKQDMLDFMGWMRKQPLPKRRHSNPNRTYNNKVSYVAIFLKEFGVSRMLKKKEYPQFHKKKVVAHPENELSVLYGHANEKERFLLDFFIGSMVRDHEAYACCYSDLTGTTLTISSIRPAPWRSVPGSPMRPTSARTQQIRMPVPESIRSSRQPPALQTAKYRPQGGGEAPQLHQHTSFAAQRLPSAYQEFERFGGGFQDRSRTHRCLALGGL